MDIQAILTQRIKMILTTKAYDLYENARVEELDEVIAYVTNDFSAIECQESIFDDLGFYKDTINPSIFILDIQLSFMGRIDNSIQYQLMELNQTPLTDIDSTDIKELLRLQNLKESITKKSGWIAEFNKDFYKNLIA